MLTADPSLLTAELPPLTAELSLSPMDHSGTLLDHSRGLLDHSGGLLERSGKPSGRPAARPGFRKWLIMLGLSTLARFGPFGAGLGGFRGIQLLKWWHKSRKKHLHLHALAPLSYHATNTKDLLMSSPEELGFQKAKERIETCLQNNSGGTQLDLSNCFLTSSALKELLQLPIAKTQLAKIEILNLSNNQLTELPSEIAELSTLNSIKLSHNKLDSIPGPLKLLINLGSISAEHNRITAITDDIANLVNLISIELDDNQIYTISDKIIALKILHTLKLSNNRISKLPDGIGELKALMYLDLSANDLQSLPLSLKNHESLRRLILHNNEKLGIPPTILGPTVEESKFGKSALAFAKSILNYYFNRNPQETPSTKLDTEKTKNVDLEEEDEEEEWHGDDDASSKQPTDRNNSSNNSHKTDDQPVRDHATEDNEMGPSWDKMVNGVASFLKNAKSPFVLSIEGSWGTGKSSMMLQLRRKLEQKHKDKSESAVGKHGETDQFRIIWFNPWRYETGKDACVGLLFELIAQIHAPQCACTRACSWLSFRTRKHDSWRMLWAAFYLFLLPAMIISLLVYLDNLQLMEWIPWAKWFLRILLSWLPTLFLLSIWFRKPLATLGGEIKHFFAGGKYLDSVEGPMELHRDFHHWLNVLLKNDQKLVVMMDDLDRCAGARPVEVLDALQQLLSPPGDSPSDKQVGSQIIVVMGIDRERVAASVAMRHDAALKYHRTCPDGKSPDAQVGIQFGYEYLQKFITLPYHLPRCGQESMRAYLESIAPEAFTNLKGKRTAESAEPIPSEPSEPSTPLKPPPEGLAPEPSQVEVQKTAEEAQRTLESESVAIALEQATSILENNPRLIKHFLNLLRIRWHILCQLAQSGNPDYRIQAVARLALLEVSRPNLFRQIVTDESKRNEFIEWLVCHQEKADEMKRTLIEKLGESQETWLMVEKIFRDPWAGQPPDHAILDQKINDEWVRLLADEI